LHSQNVIAPYFSAEIVVTLGNRCPVCLGAFLKPASVMEAGGGYRVDCPACGSFAVGEEAWDDFLDPQSGPGSKLTSVQRARISHRLRVASRDGSAKKPKLSEDFVSRFIADGYPGPTPAEQADAIIEVVGDSVAATGARMRSLPDDLYAVVGAPNPALANELAIELAERGLLVGSPLQTIGAPSSLMHVGLTLSGWDKYQAAKQGRLSGNYGFIAMKFGVEELDRYVERIMKPAIKVGIGYDIVSMRDVPRAGVIDNIMRAQIRDSAFVLAELTHDNSGAYWEAGYAEGLGKPVVYLCQRQKFDEAKTHFDTNHCTTVLWSPGEEQLFSQELVATLRRSLNLFLPDKQS